MSFETHLESLGYKLPPSPKALAAYIPSIRSGNLVWTSGQLPMISGNLGLTGKLGSEISIEEGTEQAKIAVLNALACIKAEIGDLDKIQRVLKLGVYVASIPFFTEHHVVANGASKVLQEIFGETGRHVRFAIGVASLPLDACVEVELMVEVK